MKKSYKIFSIFFITVLLFSSLCFATTAIDQNTAITNNQNNEAITNGQNNEAVTNNDVMTISENLPENNEINSDVFITQDNVIVNQKVNGSLYLIGNEITVSSPEVKGNVFAIGNEIEITGKVNGSVYAISTDIELNGEVDDLYLMTNSLEILENASCRDIKVISNDVEIAGNVNRDLYAFSSNVNIENTATSKIGGVLYATGNVIGQTDKVNEISKVNIQIEKNDELINIIAKAIGTFYFISTAVMAFVIIGIIVLCIRKSEIYRSEVREMFFKDLLYGVICWIVCVLITLALMLTIIGIPVSILFAVIIWLLFWKINLPVASIELSKFILKDSATSKWMIFIVAFGVFLAIHFITLIPVLGDFVKYIISLYGFGFIYRKLFKREKERKVEVEIVEENKE